MTTPARARIVLELIELPSDRPLPIRLRLVLKDLLRRQQLKCIGIRQEPGEAAAVPPAGVEASIESTEGSAAP